NRMIQTKNRTEILHPIGGRLEAALVKVVTKEIRAIGAGEIVGAVAIEILQQNARQSFDERANLQMLLDVGSELEWHAVRVHELQIRNTTLESLATTKRFRCAVLQQPGQAPEGTLALRRDVTGRIIRAEKPLRSVLIERHQPGQPLGQP